MHIKFIDDENREIYWINRTSSPDTNDIVHILGKRYRVFKREWFITDTQDVGVHLHITPTE